MLRNHPPKYPATNNLKNEMAAVLRDGLPLSYKKNGVCPVIQVAIIGRADRETVFNALDELIERPEIKQVMALCPGYSVKINVLEDDILYDPSSAAGYATLWCHYQSHTCFVLHESESFLNIQAAGGINPPDNETCLCMLSSKTPVWYVLHFGNSKALARSMDRFAKMNDDANAAHIIHHSSPFPAA